MTTTYVDTLEMVTEHVSDWGVKIVNKVLDVLMPDGRPYGFKQDSVEEQLATYMQLRGNTEAWMEYILEKAQDIEKRLADAALPPDEIAAVHPWDIAQKLAIEYSVRMETELAKHVNSKADSGRTTEPGVVVGSGSESSQY